MTMEVGVAAKVVECFGRRAIVQFRAGERRTASVFGKRTTIVCGDEVRVIEVPGSDELQVTEVRPRKTEFSRTDSRGKTETLAANITLLAVICAPEPAPDLYVVDRYLAGAAYAGIRSLVLSNKSDLANDDILEEYRSAGFPSLRISAVQRSGIDELQTAVRGETFLLVGQSGVGKSTLTNLLLTDPNSVESSPRTHRLTRELSAASEGRHTTVSTALFDLADDTALIDSPGVRDYAPTPLADDKVQVGWPEILSRAPQCRFNDCLHLREPGCAVLAAVESKEISSRRYESYKRLMNIMRGLLPRHERK